MPDGDLEATMISEAAKAANRGNVNVSHCLFLAPSCPCLTMTTEPCSLPNRYIVYRATDLLLGEADDTEGAVDLPKAEELLQRLV